MNDPEASPEKAPEQAAPALLAAPPAKRKTDMLIPTVIMAVLAVALLALGFRKAAI
jgi:hypothetical protein